VLLQTELGDVFKLVLEYTHGADGAIGQVENMKIKYFETLPLAVDLCLFKSGFMFLAAEFGNHALFQIDNLGDDEEDQPEFQSVDFDQAAMIGTANCIFKPRNLRNLSLVDEIESLSPLIDSLVINLGEEENPQIYTLCGKGARSTLRMLRHGLEVNEIAVSELPGNPSSIWTVRGSEGNFI
jgi:splicing factor 3B subunit 3